MAHRVETPVYEGPVEGLYRLVSTHDIDILEVPLAPMVEAFVTLLAAEHPDVDVNTVSDFLQYGAVLVELKSRTLLPGPDMIEEDEELAGWDSRDVLLSRLLECQAYAAGAEIFAVLIERAHRSAPREVGLDEDFVVHAPDLLAGVTPERLSRAYRKATAVRPAPNLDLSHVTVDAVTVSEAVAELTSVLPGRGTATFRVLTEGLGNRMEIIVRFLALLELCKLGKVELGQGTTFGDLEVRWIDDAATSQHEPAAAVGVEGGGTGLVTGTDEYDG